MALDEMETSHELADALEVIARALRMLPAVRLDDSTEDITGRRKRSIGQKSVGQAHMPEELTLFAETLPELSRLEAEACLNSLTVSSIREIAPLLDIRIPSKGTKGQYIQLLLTQLFDAPAGQELIRTYHKRHQKS